MQNIYLDHNATSPPTEAHIAALVSIMYTKLANPSSPHKIGRKASVLLADARREIVHACGGKISESELIFTSGGTEANNLVIRGHLDLCSWQKKEAHVVVSLLEHPSVRTCLETYLERYGTRMTWVKPLSTGHTLLESYLQAITPQTTLICMMAAHNELGVRFPVKDLGDLVYYARFSKWLPGADINKLQPLWEQFGQPLGAKFWHNVHVHVDGVQALGKIPAEEWVSLGVDSFAISGHKLGALAGVGACLLRKGRLLMPQSFGGTQEKSRRVGTENVLGIVSFGLACADVNHLDYPKKIIELQKKFLFLHQALCALPAVHMHTPLNDVLPHVLFFSVDNPNLKAEDLLVELDLCGIYASSGTACSSSVRQAAKSVVALEKNDTLAKNTVRFSLSVHTAWEDIFYVIEKVSDILKKY